MLDGILILSKPEGISSQGAVTRVKRALGVAKAGHTGTLDPMASGVLPILVGKGAKASEFLLSSDKYYTATLRLGMTTDTEDTTGTVLSTADTLPSEAEVRAAAASFLGESEQIPPMYSALKIGGKKLCDLARRGEVVDREPRAIRVHELTVTRLSESDYRLDVHCSKGTYIRTLCADIGSALGVGGVMASLCRTRAAGYTLADAITLADLEALPPEERAARVHPTESIFAAWRKITLPPFFGRLARNGQPIYLEKIGERGTPCEKIALYDADGFFAVGEIGELEGHAVVRPIRQF